MSTKWKALDMDKWVDLILCTNTKNLNRLWPHGGFWIQNQFRLTCSHPTLLGVTYCGKPSLAGARRARHSEAVSCYHVSVSMFTLPAFWCQWIIFHWNAACCLAGCCLVLMVLANILSLFSAHKGLLKKEEEMSLSCICFVAWQLQKVLGL